MKVRNRGLNDRQVKAVMHVKERARITNKEYREVSRVTNRTALRDLKFLVEAGIFAKEGVTTGLKFKLTSVNSGQVRSETEE